MPNYRYRAMNGSGEVISGAMAGASTGEVARRIEALGLVLVETLSVESAPPQQRSFGLFNQPRAEDVTVFTRDLGLLLRAGEQTGEILWRLPLHEEYDRLIKGTYADLDNAPEARKAGTIV